MDEFDVILGAAPKSEKAIVNETLVELSALPNSIVWRNNTGQAWQGKRLDLGIGATVVIRPGMVVLADARPVKFGLVGSADIIGSIQGLPVAVEDKAAAGRQREAQRHFEAAWTRAGGLYVLARSVAEAVDAVRRRLTG